MNRIELPDYKSQSDTVRKRFQSLKERPVELEINNLCKTFYGSNEIEVLRDVNLKVYHREFMAVLGASGCGKSTLNQPSSERLQD